MPFARVLGSILIFGAVASQAQSEDAAVRRESADRVPAEPGEEIGADRVPGVPSAPERSQPTRAEGIAHLEELSDPPPVSQLFPGEEEAPAPDISQNVTINLLRLLVKKGLLTQSEAYGMVVQAQQEAEAARREAAEATAAANEEADDAMQVSYVPELVRNEMRDEIRNQIMADLRTDAAPEGEGGEPSTVPDLELAGRDHSNVFGDIRLRYELNRFPEGNDNTGAFPNFNSINSGAPFDTAGILFSPQRNVDQERQRYLLRARLGAEIPVDDHFSVGVRVATGSSDSPVSTNQGLGSGFSKYAIWLDRAFVRYQFDYNSFGGAIQAGRFDNPFVSTPILFDEDLGFDGLVAKFSGRVGGRLKPFVTAGAFPIYNTDFNFSSNQPAKFESDDKFLFAAQSGLEIKLREDLNAKIAVAYYDFKDVEGRLSTPYLPLTSSDAGDTDSSRPSFAQYGNTYRPLRNIIADPLNDFGTSSQYQYFGLASPHKPVVVSGNLDYTGFEPVQLSVYGEYIKNTAFDQQDIESVAVNNRGPLRTDAAGNPIGLGLFDGSDTAWIVGMKVGRIAMEEKWDWTLGASYRWVGSDAVIDGFNDSDFGGGGTNVKGFGIDANLALSPDASLGVRWLSSDEIAGPPLKNDTLQVSFSIKF